MPARDSYHDQVRNALNKDGWRITHDPLTIRYKGLMVFVDLGAEKVEKDESGEQRIAVEIKVLGAHSPVSSRKPSANTTCIAFC